MTDKPLGEPIGKAADFLGVHVATLRGWAATGKIRATRSGGNRWRFAQSDLESFVAEQSNRQEATA